MTKLLGVAPVLLVHDVIASAHYWEHRLGFATRRFWGEPPSFCMPRRDGLIVMLSQAPADHAIAPYWRIVDELCGAYFWVNDVEALHAEFVGRGAAIHFAPTVQPYDVLELGVQDIDGHLIVFGQDLERRGADTHTT